MVPNLEKKKLPHIRGDILHGQYYGSYITTEATTFLPMLQYNVR